MKRGRLVKSLVSKTAIVPFKIKTLYDNDADALNDPSRTVSLALNKSYFEDNIKRLQLTAAEAECAVLAGNQVNFPHSMFVVHKNVNKQQKWISDKYLDSSGSNTQMYDCFINAKITSTSQLKSVKQEESVSFPFLNADTNRFAKTDVQYIDTEGNTKTETAEGFRAFAIQQAWDYSEGRHLLDWRLHLGNLRVQENVAEKMPKTSSVIEQYCKEIKAMLRKFPTYSNIPVSLGPSEVKWLSQRGCADMFSIEADYLSRIHKHYRKQMILLLQRIEHNLI